MTSRVNGRDETIAFVLGMLGLGPARAMDDWSDHLWTLDEVAADAEVDGQVFFSSPGWT